MEIIIPDVFTATVRRSGQEIETVAVKNEHTGSIALPDVWYGRDLADYPQDEPGKEPGWLLQWQWAKKRVVEWAIDGLPTNPNQLKDTELPWHVLNFIVKSAYTAMTDYAMENTERWADNLVMPEPYKLTAGEFLAWHELNLETRKRPVPKGHQRIIASFREYVAFVRQWPPGVTVDPSGAEMDLSLITAVVDRGNAILEAAANLGNLLALPGGRLTQGLTRATA
jgi:hypothetical protein